METKAYNPEAYDSVPMLVFLWWTNQNLPPNMELLIRARIAVGRVPMKALYGDENEAQDVEYKDFYHAHWNKVSLLKAAKSCTHQNAA